MVEHLAAVPVRESPCEPRTMRNTVVLVVQFFDRDARGAAALSHLTAASRQAHIIECAHFALFPDAEREFCFLITNQAAKPRIENPANGGAIGPYSHLLFHQSFAPVRAAAVVSRQHLARVRVTPLLRPRPRRAFSVDPFGNRHVDAPCAVPGARYNQLYGYETALGRLV